jgi:hypothetical protein
MLSSANFRRTCRRSFAGVFGAVFLAAAAGAQDSMQGAGTRWSPEDIVPLTTELVLELRAEISPPVQVGESDAGHRQFIPITGGYFVGDGIRGTVLPGGADWQLLRADGVRELVAIYAIQTDDGATITVENRGISVPPGQDGGERYVRSTPRFHAPAGKYEWLNEGIFVGSVTGVPDGSAVIIRVFRVR